MSLKHDHQEHRFTFTALEIGFNVMDCVKYQDSIGKVNVHNALS